MDKEDEETTTLFKNLFLIVIQISDTISCMRHDERSFLRTTFEKAISLPTHFLIYYL